MKIPEDGKLLRIFIGEADKWEGKPLYESIVLLAKKEGMESFDTVRAALTGRKSYNSLK